VPNIFGMNFQALSVGEKLVEKSLGMTCGYVDAPGTPSDSLFAEIQYVDGAVGQMVAELKKLRTAGLDPDCHIGQAWAVSD
jgi:hypothetical protein